MAKKPRNKIVSEKKSIVDDKDVKTIFAENKENSADALIENAVRKEFLREVTFIDSKTGETFKTTRGQLAIKKMFDGFEEGASADDILKLKKILGEDKEVKDINVNAPSMFLGFGDPDDFKSDS